MAAISRWSEPAGTALSSASTCRRDDAAGVGNPSAAQGAGLDSIAPRCQNPDTPNPDTRCYNGRAMTDTLTRCDAILGRYSGKPVLVTGADGFIGSHLVEIGRASCRERVLP